MKPASTSDKIVFVYNADEGFFNALTDTAHKIFSPATYQCNLCRFTYGLTGMVLPWKNFIDSLPIRPVFIHRTEFRRSYPGLPVDLPVVLSERNGKPDVMLTAVEIANARDVEGLIAALTRRLAELDQTAT